MSTLQQLASLVSAERIRDAGVPTASIALMEHPDGEVETHVITAGPENADTIYQAVSIPKAVTSLVVHRLIVEGVLSLETRVVDLVPENVWGSIIDARTADLTELVTVG